MTLWLAQHLGAFRLAARRLAASPLNTVLSLVAIGVALALPAGGQMLVANAVEVLRGAAPQPRLSVFMAVGAEDGATRAVAERLQRHAGVAKVEFLPRDATLARMKAAPGLRDAIDALGRNPFPDAFAVTPRDESAAAMERLAADIRPWAKVEHVQLDSAWAKRLDALLRLARTGVVALALLLGAGLIAVTFNIIRLQVLTMRAEIEVGRLLGATEGFIRRPFLYYGALLGALGGAVALILTGVTGWWLKDPLAELAALYGLGLQLDGVDPAAAAGLIAIATGLGWTGAGLSLRQNLPD